MLLIRLSSCCSRFCFSSKIGRTRAATDTGTRTFPLLFDGDTWLSAGSANGDSNATKQHNTVQFVLIGSLHNVHCATGFRIDEPIQSPDVIRRSCYAPFRTEGRTHRRAEGILTTVAANQVSSPVNRSRHRYEYSSIRLRCRVGRPHPPAQRNRASIVPLIAL